MGIVELYLVKVSEGKEIERKLVITGEALTIDSLMKPAVEAVREAAKRTARGR